MKPPAQHGYNLVTTEMGIAILSEKTASQIAAGEVVERPVSVIKELIENSLDAGCTQITIRFLGSGQRLIEVSDDGEGIPAGELPLAVARHATSKLRDADELSRIHTLGFRGEALASIASVSHFSMLSRTSDSITGSLLEVDGSQVLGVKSIASPPGTTVKVEDLFFNTPARLKFLKQERTEKQAVENLVIRYAAAYPNVKFQMYLDGKLQVNTEGRGDRESVMRVLFDLQTARQLLNVDTEEEGYRIEGYTSPISLTRSNRKDITFFVNGRWIVDATLNTALVQAYHTYLMVGRYPLAALFLEIPPDELDVNVHPAKAEVRFRFPDKVFSLVQRSVRRSLLSQSTVPHFTGKSWQPYMPSSSGIQNVDIQRNENNSESSESQAAPGGQQGIANPTQSSFSFGGLPVLRLVGQIGAAYLVAEGPDGLYLIDQHAAHERVLYERFRDRHHDGISSQVILEPVIFDVPPGKIDQFSSQLETLKHLGFEIEPFGSGSYRIRSLPAIVSGVDPQEALRVVFEDFEEDETPLQGEVESKLIARICKRAAVKAGKTLSRPEQEKLLQDLEGCESPRTCPHGRPTMIHLSVDLLERQFGRRGSR
jgi:DNA mismatch repair protein MutL